MAEIAVIIDKMKKKKELEKEYGPKMKQRKDGRYYVYIARKQIVANDKEALYDKLYDLFYGFSNWSMVDIFPECQKWVKEISAVKGITLKRNQELFDRYFKCHETASIPLKKLTIKDIIALYRSWTKGRTMTSKEFSNLRSIVNSIYKYAISELEIVDINIAKNINLRQFPLKQVNHDGEVFSIDDRKKILDYLAHDDSIYSLAIQFAFYIPFRIGELFGLKWTDIDGNRLRIKRQRVTSCEMNDDLTFTSKHYEVVNQTKGFNEKGIRYVYLGEKAKAILERIRKVNPDSEYIFANKDGKLLLSSSFNRKLKKICEKINISPWSSHKIRFCVASMYYLSGVNIIELQRIMGHTTVQMTMHYLRDIIADKKAEEIITGLE